MAYKAKAIIMSIIAIILLAAVAFEVYYFFFKNEVETAEVS